MTPYQYKSKQLESAEKEIERLKRLVTSAAETLDQHGAPFAAAAYRALLDNPPTPMPTVAKKRGAKKPDDSNPPWKITAEERFMKMRLGSTKKSRK